MKNWLLLIALVSLTSIFGQFQQFPKLEQMRQKKQWEKLYKKANSITENTKTKNEPFPYFYKAEALFNIDKDVKLNKKYKKAFRLSMKALEKGLIKDDRHMVELKFVGFLMDFKVEAFKRGDAQLEMEKHNKALPFYEAAYGVDLDTIAQTKIALCQLKADPKKGQETIAKVVKRYRHSFDTKQGANYDSTAFMIHARHLLERAIVDSAYELSTAMTQIFPEYKEVEELHYLIVRNYCQFYFHYNKYFNALRISIASANAYPNSKKFLSLETESMKRFTEVEMIAGQDKILKRIWAQYTSRKRDPNTLENLKGTNFMFAEMIADYHHTNQAPMAKKMLRHLLDINIEVKESLGNKDIYSFVDLGNDFISDLMEKEEYYLAHLMARYIKMFIPNDPEIIALSRSAKQQLSDTKLNFNAQAKEIIATKKASKETFTKVLKGLKSVKSYDIVYSLIRVSDEVYPNDPIIDELKRQIMVDDYKINMKGSKVVKTIIDGKVKNELGWNGNLKKCRPGTLSETAHFKTEQRINYFRRFAGIDVPLNFKKTLNGIAQKIAFELHPDNECKKQDLAAKYSGTQLNGAHSSDAVYQMMSTNGDVGSRQFILNPNINVVGHGSTDKNAVFITDPNNNKHYPKYDTTAICWPPKGMIPGELVYPKWTFSIPGADFTDAKVKMRFMGRELSAENIDIEPYDAESPNAHTFAWTPKEVILYAQIDLTYSVEVFGVKLPGSDKYHGFKYDVTIIPSK